MKLIKNIKIKRCKECAYYEKLVGMHWCTNTELYHKFNLKVITPIPMFCFKEKRKEIEKCKKKK